MTDRRPIPKGSPTTQEKANRAYDYYFALGKVRSLQKVSSALKIGLRQLKDWSARFSWQERLEADLAEIDRQATRKTLRSIATQRAQYTIGLHNGLVKFFTGLTKGDINIETIGEMSVALQNLRLEMGQSTENLDIKTSATAAPTESNIFQVAKEMGPEAEVKLNELVGEITRRRRAAETSGEI